MNPAPILARPLRIPYAHSMVAAEVLMHGKIRNMEKDLALRCGMVANNRIFVSYDCGDYRNHAARKGMAAMAAGNSERKAMRGVSRE